MAHTVEDLGETRSRHPLLEHPRPIPIAHRGGSLENEENTMPAFAHAVALGYRHLETDVHLTADGQVVIHHDPTLKRMTGDPRAIADLTWAELQSVRTPKGAGLMLLSNLLEEYSNVFINIETKSDQVVAPLVDVIQRMKALPRIGTGSFSPWRTRQLLTALGADLCWSPGHLSVLGLWLRGWRIPLRLGTFPMVQVPCRFRGITVVTPRFVRAAHAQGIQVQVWTVDEAPEMHRLLNMGVDALMTDRPTVLKQVLIERGEWRSGT